MNISHFLWASRTTQKGQIETVLEIHKMFIKFPLAEGKAELGIVLEKIPGSCVY